jgi:hypothetical protein
MTRQKRLEDIKGGQMADTWFSLHVKGMNGKGHLTARAKVRADSSITSEPVYVSEEMKNVMVSGPPLLQCLGIQC